MLKSSFSPQIPSYFPSNVSGKGIGFIGATGFDDRNIAVIQNTLQTIIARNTDASYVVFSYSAKIIQWADEYLRIYKVPAEKKAFVYPEGYEPKSKYQKLNEQVDNLQLWTAKTSMMEVPKSVSSYAQKGIGQNNRRRDEQIKVFQSLNKKNPIWYTLQKYKELMGAYQLDTVVIFTDNSGATEIHEMKHFAKQYGFRIITVDCEGNFNDATDEQNPLNHREHYGGIYHNKHREV